MTAEKAGRKSNNTGHKDVKKGGVPPEAQKRGQRIFAIL